MNTSLNHGSAEIYQFPAGGRAALGGLGYQRTTATAEAASIRASEYNCSDSWYHAAAIEESKRER